MRSDSIMTGESGPSANMRRPSLPVTRFGPAHVRALPLPPFASALSSCSRRVRSNLESQIYVGRVARVRSFDVAINSLGSVDFASTATLADRFHNFGSGLSFAAGGTERVPESIEGCRPKASNGERRPAAFNGRPARASNLQG